tara:strand:- start:10226 stop:10468 length:243 start_codon:yes stop_codon:yes gene_type:complete
LFEKYNQPGGQWKLELDLLVANEIAEQLNESVQKDSKGRKKKNANKAIARRDQKRKLHTPAETAKQLNALIDNKGVKKDG